jgi:hypothetical protein
VTAKYSFQDNRDRLLMKEVPSYSVAGLCGFFPIHPRCYMHAWRSRRDAETEAAGQAAKCDDQGKE